MAKNNSPPSANARSNACAQHVDLHRRQWMGPNFQPAQSSRERDEMKVALPRVIKEYVDASNTHDVNDILSCFSEDAVVQDEGETLRGKKPIEDWIVKTIEKYKFQFKPLSAKSDDTKVVVSIEVSGTFPGSPVNPDYHFSIQGGKIRSLAIE
jgi:ketosteroid isomerase-like protein